MEKMNLQLFTNEYDDYCDFSASAAAAVAGKDWVLQVWSTADTPELLAIAGQRSLTINRSAATIDVSSKDTEGGWGAAIAGTKEWSIDVDGVYVASDDSMKVLSAAFTNGDLLCIKIVNSKTTTDLFGGLVAITDFPLEAPYDDAVTYSLTLSGNGPLTDLSDEDDSE